MDKKIIYGIRRIDMVELNMFDREWEDTLEEVFYETYELAEHELFNRGYIQEIPGRNGYVISYRETAEIVELPMMLSSKI